MIHFFERERLEFDDDRDQLMEMLSTSMPNMYNEKFIHFEIKMVFEYTGKNGMQKLTWCQEIVVEIDRKTILLKSN